MKWYSKLYVGENARKKERKIIRKLKMNVGMLDVYVITLPSNRQNNLDIISSIYLKQAAVRRNLPMVVGIACGYEEAMNLVVQITEETFANTHDVKIPEYLAKKIKGRR